MPRIQRDRPNSVAHYWDKSGLGQWRGPVVERHEPALDGSQAQPTSPTVREVITVYRTAGRYRNLTESSKQSYELYLTRIAEKFGDVPISAFEKRGARAAIRQWRDNVMAVRPRTADLTVGTLRRLLNFAVEEEYINRNPAARLGSLHTTSRRDMIWSDRQIASFLTTAPRHLARVLLLAIWTGQRQSDLLALTWDCYDGAYIRLQQRKATGGHGRRVKVRVAGELRKVLDEIKKEQIARSQHADPTKRVPEPSVILTNERGRPWRSGFRCAWRRATCNACIEGVTFHDLRGTFITLAHRGGSTIKEIAEASGHDEFECERLIRHHYLASGAELLISRLEVISEFANVSWGSARRDYVHLSPAAENLLRGKERRPGLRRPQVLPISKLAL